MSLASSTVRFRPIPASQAGELGGTLRMAETKRFTGRFADNSSTLFARMIWANGKEWFESGMNASALSRITEADHGTTATPTPASTRVNTVGSTLS